MWLIDLIKWDDATTVAAVATIAAAVLGVAAVILGAAITWLYTSRQAKKARQLALQQQQQEFDQERRQQEREFDQQRQQQEKAHNLALNQEETTHQLVLRQDEQSQKLAHINAIEQSKVSHNVMVNTDRLRREIAALESVWTLLGYMSDKKSDKAIIHWEKKRGEGGKPQKIYFFSYYNLKQFLFHEMGDVFYLQHAGLFIANDIRDLLYSYRTVAAGFYFAHPKGVEIPEDGLILVNKSEQVEKLKEIYKGLNKLLREELETRYQAMMV